MPRNADANTDAPNDPYLPEFGSELMRYEILVDGVDTFRTIDRKITQEEVQCRDTISLRQQNVIFHGGLGSRTGKQGCLQPST